MCVSFSTRNIIIIMYLFISELTYLSFCVCFFFPFFYSYFFPTFFFAFLLCSSHHYFRLFFKPIINQYVKIIIMYIIQNHYYIYYRAIITIGTTLINSAVTPTYISLWQNWILLRKRNHCELMTWWFVVCWICVGSVISGLLDRWFYYLKDEIK